MAEPGVDAQQELVRQSKRQTELLSQINMLLWAFAAAAILVGVLLIVSS